MESELSQNTEFPITYFVALHTLVATPTTQYGAYTPNYLGARIPLQHTKLNIERWKYHLVGYEGAEITKFLEFGDYLETGLMRRELSGLCRSPRQSTDDRC